MQNFALFNLLISGGIRCDYTVHPYLSLLVSEFVVCIHCVFFHTILRSFAKYVCVLSKEHNFLLLCLYQR